ncbi:ABC transporter ATP-binding protein [Lactiplantibacillus fabifermentans T30PCM01]|uniref:ABC transporter ATP-binding protein n=1 Tax=Lactiplantibacillus fabifermentans T30PCM01 TaxID=1400520 RepID=W6T419_9LACO|nr:ABC transporter ATP-binding protein [Lactiplantibacillus fabifermentans]ETY72539.1 ABC transporter ATP-binding protein [Lactiplantibacillus fabifermentans T30PCM01]
MLTIKQVQKKYANFNLNVTVALPTGQIIGVLGPNGAGKSTLFKILMGLTQPDAGQLEFNGQTLATWRSAHPAAISATFPDSGFNEKLTIKEIAQLLAAFYPTSFTPDFLTQCQQLGLPIAQPVQTFSTGMQAKLKLLVALSHGAQLLILDEPTAGLDVTMRQTLLQLIVKYHQDYPQATILISSHIASDIETLAEQVVLITAGTVQLHADLATIQQHYGLFTVAATDFATLDQHAIIHYWPQGNQVRCLTANRAAFANLSTLKPPAVDDLLLAYTTANEEVPVA